MPKGTPLILVEQSLNPGLWDPRADSLPIHQLISFIQLVFRGLPLLPGLGEGALKMNQGASIPSAHRQGSILFLPPMSLGELQQVT